MKNLNLFILLFALLTLSCSKNDRNDLPQSTCDFIDFKYYNGAEYYLGELSNDYILIGIDTSYSDSDIRNFISNIIHFDQSYDYIIHITSQYKFKEIPVKFKSSKSCEEITQIISELEQNAIISYAHYTMQTDDCNNLIDELMGNKCINSYGSSFHVKVFDADDLTDLNQMIIQTNTELVKQNEFMKNWFELSATKRSNGDALKMANFFCESGLFAYSEPGISKYPVE